jgi:hypothetical protein
MNVRMLVVTLVCLAMAFSVTLAADATKAADDAAAKVEKAAKKPDDAKAAPRAERRAEPKAEKREAPPHFVGVIKAEKDTTGKVTGATLTVKAKKEGEDAQVFTIVMDENGQKAAACDGKTCMVRGTVEEKEGVKSLKVTSCREGEMGKVEKKEEVKK